MAYAINTVMLDERGKPVMLTEKDASNKDVETPQTIKDYCVQALLQAPSNQKAEAKEKLLRDILAEKLLTTPADVELELTAKQVTRIADCCDEVFYPWVLGQIVKVLDPVRYKTLAEEEEGVTVAIAVVEYLGGLTGLLLTVDLYPLGSDTAAATSIDLTEATNRLGLYTGTKDASALSGVYQAIVRIQGASAPLDIQYVKMSNDTTVHRLVPFAAVGSTDGLSVNFASSQIVFKKGAAFANFTFQMALNTDHISPGIGLGSGVVAQRCLDGNPYVSCDNAVAEVGSGTYKISFSAADLNANCVTFRFTGAGCDATVFTFVTQP